MATLRSDLLDKAGVLEGLLEKNKADLGSFEKTKVELVEEIGVLNSSDYPPEVIEAMSNDTHADGKIKENATNLKVAKEKLTNVEKEIERLSGIIVTYETSVKTFLSQFMQSVKDNITDIETANTERRKMYTKMLNEKKQLEKQLKDIENVPEKQEKYLSLKEKIFDLNELAKDVRTKIYKTQLKIDEQNQMYDTMRKEYFEQYGVRPIVSNTEEVEVDDAVEEEEIDEKTKVFDKKQPKEKVTGNEKEEVLAVPQKNVATKNISQKIGEKVDKTIENMGITTPDLTEDDIQRLKKQNIDTKLDVVFDRDEEDLSEEYKRLYNNPGLTPEGKVKLMKLVAEHDPREYGINVDSFFGKIKYNRHMKKIITSMGADISKCETNMSHLSKVIEDKLWHNESITNGKELYGSLSNSRKKIDYEYERSNYPIRRDEYSKWKHIKLVVDDMYYDGADRRELKVQIYSRNLGKIIDQIGYKAGESKEYDRFKEEQVIVDAYNGVLNKYNQYIAQQMEHQPKKIGDSSEILKTSTTPEKSEKLSFLEALSGKVKKGPQQVEIDDSELEKIDKYVNVKDNKDSNAHIEEEIIPIDDEEFCIMQQEENRKINTAPSRRKYDNLRRVPIEDENDDTLGGDVK